MGAILSHIPNATEENVQISVITTDLFIIYYMSTSHLMVWYHDI